MNDDEMLRFHTTLEPPVNLRDGSAVNVSSASNGLFVSQPVAFHFVVMKALQDGSAVSVDYSVAYNPGDGKGHFDHSLSAESRSVNLFFSSSHWLISTSLLCVSSLTYLSSTRTMLSCSPPNSTRVLPVVFFSVHSISPSYLSFRPKHFPHCPYVSFSFRFISSQLTSLISVSHCRPVLLAVSCLHRRATLCRGRAPSRRICFPKGN